MSPSLALTPSQRGVVGLRDGAYLVLAAPGSGKTEVVTQRVIALLRESAPGGFRILALTFTRKAADNMRARLREQVHDQWQRVTVTTFHAFCLDVLRHHGQHVGLEAGPTVYDNEDDLLDTLALALAEEGYALPREDEQRELKALLADISRMKRELRPPESVPEERLRGGIPVRVAYAAYDDTLRRHGAVDFDDLLRLTYQVFAAAPRVANHYRRLYRYILVDEAQDTSAAQYALLRALCGDEHRNIMLVADPDQFIYRFAGASDRYLRAFIRDFQAKEKHLAESFRCAATIARAASALIGHYRTRSNETAAIQAATDARGLVTAASYADEDAEARAALRCVKQLLRHGMDPAWLGAEEPTDIAPEDVCILARARYHLDAVLDTFKAAGQPFAFRSGHAFLFESPLFRFVHRAMRVLQSENDVLPREALMAEIAGLDQDTRDEIRDKPLRSLFETLARATNGPVAAAAALVGRATAGATALDRLPDQVLTLASAESARCKDEDMRHLMESDARALRARWEAHRTAGGPGGLGAFVSDLALVGRTPLDEPGVRVLTVHAAKGLEFKAVILVGMNEGSFPDFRSLATPGGIADEARIAYVAVTRAARRLHLTRPRSRRMPWGAVKPQSPSRYIGAMGLSFKDMP